MLLAAYSVLALWSANLGEVSLTDTLTTLIVVMTGTGLLYLALRLTLPGRPAHAGLICSFLLLVCLFYGYGAALAALPWGGSVSYVNFHLGLFLAVFVLSILFAAFILRRSTSLRRPTLVLNVATASLVLVSAGQIGYYEWPNRGHDAFVDALIESEPTQDGRPVATVPPARDGARSIYYLILDRYAGFTTMSTQYGYENRDFRRFLEDKGFFVASGSRSNYLKTAPSLASTFHMDYLGVLSDGIGKDSSDYRPIHRMLQKNRVARFLKNRDYTIAHIGSWWQATKKNDYADELYSEDIGEFERVFSEMTIFAPVLRLAWRDNPYLYHANLDVGQCRRVPRTFDILRALHRRPDPVFAFAHILVPHPPFIFDDQGNCRPQGAADGQSLRDKYVDQVKYINREIEQLVSTLLASPGEAPIIIIQADEGPYPARYSSNGWSNNGDWRQATRDELRMKTDILNAYYFPDAGYDLLYDEITPVNTFRILFNTYFGTKFELLPDLTFASIDDLHPYDLFDVTQIVR